jgi:hypothetical protein
VKNHCFLGFVGVKLLIYNAFYTVFSFINIKNLFMQIQFEQQAPDCVYHTCQGHREGDWIVFTCIQCTDYEQRINFKTKERTVAPAADPTIFHQGNYMPPVLEEADLLPN